MAAAWIAASTAKAPSGLPSLAAGAGAVLGGNYTDLDPLAEAISLIEQEGVSPTAMVANASTVLALSKLKKQTGSNEPLLNPPTAMGATQKLECQLLGVRLFTVPDTVLDDDEVWVYAKPKVFVVLRQDVDLAVDESFFFRLRQPGRAMHDACRLRIPTPCVGGEDRTGRFVAA